MVTPPLTGLCRENEAYFNGLRFEINKNFVFLIQMVKNHTLQSN
jgi:hypothetical protein